MGSQYGACGGEEGGHANMGVVWGGEGGGHANMGVPNVAMVANMLGTICHTHLHHH